MLHLRHTRCADQAGSLDIPSGANRYLATFSVLQAQLDVVMRNLLVICNIQWTIFLITFVSFMAPSLLRL
jgi:hypothetical protein